MSLYPLEIPGKTSLPGNSAKFCDTPWQFQGHQKRRTMVHMEIPWHEFFLNNTPGNSTCTSLTNPLHTHTHTHMRVHVRTHTHTHTHTLFSIPLAGNSMSSTSQPPCLDFYWNSQSASENLHENENQNSEGQILDRFHIYF